jgi:cytochrome c-type biogenesis protein CcmE
MTLTADAPATPDDAAENRAAENRAAENLAAGLDRPRARRSARRRLLVCLAIVVVALGWVAARGLTGSFVYYLTPTDVVTHHQADVGQRIRLGGYVVPGSVSRPGATLLFTVKDDGASVRVVSTGAVPELFRPGQGVVLEGALGTDGRFHSDTVLVRHSGDYRPPTQAKSSAGRSS